MADGLCSRGVRGGQRPGRLPGGGGGGRLGGAGGEADRRGAVGQQGSIAVAERIILTLKQEWLRRVPTIRGLDHLSQLCDDFAECCNG